MHFSDFYGPDSVATSFELFPPKKWRGVADLFAQFSELAACGPAFITCTYGAGGGTEKTTLDILHLIQSEFPKIPQASHLTCSGASQEELRQYLNRAREQGVEFIVALRGDPPKDADAFRPAENGLRYANELVELIARDYPDFGIAVAGYPETHPEAPSSEADLENLKRKVDAGGEVVFSQLFFDNEVFLRFRDRCAGAGIDAPIVPGVLPVSNLAQVKRITQLCGTHLPEKLRGRLEAHGDDVESQFAVGLYHATRQVEELVEEGVPGVHFYVLNQSRAANLICRALSLEHAQQL